MTLHWRVAVLAAALVSCGAVRLACGADAATSAPATMAARTQQAIIADLRTTSVQMRQVVPSLAAVADEAERKQLGDKPLPVLRKMVGLLAELASVQTEPAAKAGISAQEDQLKAFLVGFGDKETTTALEASAKDADVKVSVPAKSALTLGTWWLDSKDPAAQAKLLDAYATIAKANPTDDGVASTLGTMYELGAANDAVKKQAIAMIRANLQGDAAKQILAQADAMQAQKDLEGKPLVVAGRTSKGGKFTSADWKGKVILVDMWATWCGPCKAELPRTKKLYADYHAKGLELVGLDCDSADDTVNAFITENGMAWPQLREESQSQNQWHPLATLWHVEGIPTMFLIDRKGVLRYVDGREDTETKVKALLAEDAGK